MRNIRGDGGVLLLLSSTSHDPAETHVETTLALCTVPGNKRRANSTCGVHAFLMSAK
jgi:hypothetical protein